MQIVHFTDTRIGSFDWELPPDLTERMKALPEPMQAAIRYELEKLIRSLLHMLMAALKMGPDAEMHLDLMREVLGVLAGQLKAMAEESLRKCG